MLSPLERHDSPHDVPHGSGYDDGFQNGNDMHDEPPEPDERIDQPIEQREQGNQPEEDENDEDAEQAPRQAAQHVGAAAVSADEQIPKKDDLGHPSTTDEPLPAEHVDAPAQIETGEAVEEEPLKVPVIADESSSFGPHDTQEGAEPEPAESPVQTAYEAAAAAYIQHAREASLPSLQRAVTVPTPEGPIVYGAPDHPSQDYAIRNGGQYRTMAFGDEFIVVSKGDEEYRDEETTIKRREDPSGVVAGGIERVFEPDQVVVDLGCGQAVGLHELARDYPDARIVGVDRNLSEVREVNFDQPGLQLTQGDWDRLNDFPDGIANAVVSVGAAEAWGEIRQDGGPDFIGAVNRVTAPGGVFRFHFPGQERFMQIEERLHELGWAVDRRRYTVIAVKPNPTTET